MWTVEFWQCDILTCHSPCSIMWGEHPVDMDEEGFPRSCVCKRATHKHRLMSKHFWLEVTEDPDRVQK